MTQLGNGNPQKVLRKAAELGVHPDCIAGNMDEHTCASCKTTMHAVYDLYYGHTKSSSEMLDAVLEDLKTDRENF